MPPPSHTHYLFDHLIDFLPKEIYSNWNLFTLALLVMLVTKSTPDLH